MKKYLLLSFLVSFSALARQSIPLAPIAFRVSASSALSKFEQVVLQPENLLRRYRPVGVKISNKHVAGNEVSFVATKTVLFISKSVYVHGILESRDSGRGCYNLRMHFESSDALVTNNVSEMQAQICVKEESDSKLTASVRSQIITGDRYSSTLGPMAVNLIKEQVQPLITALSEEIQSMR